MLACGHPPSYGGVTASCGAGRAVAWANTPVAGAGKTKPKRSQSARPYGPLGGGLLRKWPVFTGDCGVWPGLRHRPAGLEKLQNEATANATAGKRQGKCCNATPQSAGGAGIVCRSATNSTLRRVGDRRSRGEMVANLIESK